MLAGRKMRSTTIARMNRRMKRDLVAYVLLERMLAKRVRYLCSRKITIAVRRSLVSVSCVFGLV